MKNTFMLITLFLSIFNYSRADESIKHLHLRAMVLNTSSVKFRQNQQLVFETYNNSLKGIEAQKMFLSDSGNKSVSLNATFESQNTSKFSQTILMKMAKDAIKANNIYLNVVAN